MENLVDEKKAQITLEKGYVEAEKILGDEDKMERFLFRLEKKLKTIPVAGEQLSYAPIMVSLLRSYVKKEYKDVPVGTIVAVISALVYFLSPVDILPDVIPGVGYIDDALVIAACWKLVESDINEYIAWRELDSKATYA